MAQAGKEVSKHKNSKIEKHGPAATGTSARKQAPNPVWFKPVMFGFMLVGLIWIVTYYVTASNLVLPVPQLGQANIFVGFGLIIVGFLMTTRWR